MTSTGMDTVELNHAAANPSLAGHEKALAGFRSFLQPGDDSESHRVPLKEMLDAEGDIAGDVLSTEEHLKKLKFNYTEICTKRRWVQAVQTGQIDESAEQSAELGERRASLSAVLTVY